MLKGLDPLIGPDMLHMLASMGHGDSIVIADANFPSVSVGRRLARLDGVGTPEALRAILTVVPLDQYVEAPVAVMAVVGEPHTILPIFTEVQGIAEAAEARDVMIERVERFAFYERAKEAFGVVVTSETRLYGNIIISKGVITPAPTA
jgi:L-fucose mutarotase